MKKILLGLVLVGCAVGQVPNLLTNGWLGGSIFPLVVRVGSVQIFIIIQRLDCIFV